MKSNLLTHSRLQAARKCPRLHDYLFNHGVRPLREEEALRFGALMAEAKEAYRIAWKNGAAAASDAIGAYFATAADRTDPYELVKAEELMCGYIARYAEEDLLRAVDYRGVEKRFNAPLTNPDTGCPSRTWRVAGKADALLLEQGEDGNARVLIVEDKTSSEDITPGSEYWRRLRIDGQVSHYLAHAESLTTSPVEGVLYDVIGKVGLKPCLATPEANRKYRKDGVLYANMREHDETLEEYRARVREDIAEHPEEYFQRAIVTRLADELLEHRRELWWMGDELRERMNARRHPRNPDACRDYHRLCAFFDVCTGSASISDPYLFRTLANVHPELETPHVANGAQ